MSSSRVLLTMALVLLSTEAFSGHAEGGRNLMDLIRENGPDLEPLREKAATYRKDGRVSIVDLYQAQLEMAHRKGWILEEAFREEISLPGGERYALPSNCLRTRRKGPALWLLTGIHGEEPAGPNALAESLPLLLKLDSSGIPLVVFPLLNPLGYHRNWRYPDAAVYSKAAPGSSVGDSDHLLPDERGNPRSSHPACRQAALLTAKVLELAREYPPLLALDLHEDNLLQKGYLYSQGERGANDPVAQAVVMLLRAHGFPILMEGTTRFDEAVKGGIVSGVKDGSIDELLSSRTVLQNGKQVDGPGGKSVLVLETSSMNAGLEERKRVHWEVIASLESLWKLAKADPDGGRK